jgi:soluble lytic murein transglycosylase-like protein
MKLLKGLTILAVTSAMTLACGSTGTYQSNRHQVALAQTKSQILDTYKPDVKPERPVRKQVSTKKQKTKKNKEKPKVTKLLWSVPLSPDLQKYISQQCKQNGVPEKLAYAVMDVETGGTYNPNKISTTGDYGLFQINVCNQPELRRKLGITDFLNPYQSVKAGTYMLGQLYRKYGNVNEVAMAYNCGEGGMLSAIRRGIYSTSYSRAVLDAMYTLTQRTVQA